jgi:hypothetical protein
MRRACRVTATKANGQEGIPIFAVIKETRRHGFIPPR